MSSVLDQNSPQMRALMMLSPNGMFAAMAKKLSATAASQAAPSASFVNGSNNAGGSMDAPMPTMAGGGGQFNRYSGMAPTSQMVTANRGVGGQNFTLTGGDQGSNNNTGSMFGGTPVSFAAGGMMSAQGAPIRPGAVMQPETQLGAQPANELTGQQIEQEAKRFIEQHPEEAQKIQAVIALATQTGDLTPQELNMAVQLAKAALANPAAYPQIRQFAIQNGLGTEADVPQQLDKGLLYALLVAGMSAQSVAPKGNAMQGQGPAPSMEGGMMPSYREGGMTGDKAHIAKLHAREYVIPEDALIYHGKKHFDKLIEQARTPPDAGGQK